MIQRIIFLMGLLTVSFPCFSADSMAPVINEGWLLGSSIWLMFVAVPGLAMFYGGLVRTKNVMSIFVQCFSMMVLCSMLWPMLGYTFALTDGSSLVGDLGRVFLAGLERASVRQGIPEAAFVIYQLTIATIALCLIVGGLVERMRFGVTILFSALWLMLVYVPICHWVWGAGWLRQMGVMDFAGGIVVQSSAGVTSLIAALLLGPRKGFPHLPMPPHHLPLTAAGAGIIWVGWHGFSAGAVPVGHGTSGMATLVTQIAAAAAALAWMCMEWLVHRKASLLGLVTGVVTGLSAIAPAAGFVAPIGGLVIGVIAATHSFFVTRLLKNRFRIDDALDVFSISGVSGATGTVLVAIFASHDLAGTGILAEGGIAGQLAVQILALGAVVAWSGLVTYGLFKLLGSQFGIRVQPEQETSGLDLSQHGETGYKF